MSNPNPTPTPTPLNIILIGYGLIGPRHALSILKNPSTNLLAIIDPSPSTLPTSSTLLPPSTPFFPSLETLLPSPLRPQINAAIICTPNHTHIPLTTQLLSAGIPVLVEKPVAVDIPSGLGLLREVERTGVRVLVGHHRRFNPYLLAAKSVLQSGRLGDVVAVQGIWGLKKPLSYFQGAGEWRQSAERGGGPVLINLIHEIDLLQFLLGKIVMIQATEMRKQRGYGVEEGAAIIFRWENGIVGTFILGDNVTSPWSFEGGTGENPNIPMVGREEGAGGFYRVLGEKGSLSVPDLRVWSYGKEEGDWGDKLVVEDVKVGEGVPFDLQLEHFVNVVRGTEEVGCSVAEALSAVVVCEGVMRAMKSGSAVEIRGFEILERGGGAKL